VQGFIERLAEQVLVKAKRVVTDESGWRPLLKFRPDRPHHLVMARQSRVCQLVDRDARNQKRAGRRNDVGQKAAADFETVEFPQAGVGLNSAKLKDLVEGCVRPGGFGVVEDEAQAILPCRLIRPIGTCGGRGYLELPAWCLSPMVIAESGLSRERAPNNRAA
jgi:hypothetical protein